MIHQSIDDFISLLRWLLNRSNHPLAYHTLWWSFQYRIVIARQAGRLKSSSTYSGLKQYVKSRLNAPALAIVSTQTWSLRIKATGRSNCVTCRSDHSLLNKRQLYYVIIENYKSLNRNLLGRFNFLISTDANGHKAGAKAGDIFLPRCLPNIWAKLHTWNLKK